MKKTIRSLVGLMLALLCVFQLALTAPASAEEEPQIDPKAVVDCVLFVKNSSGKYVPVSNPETKFGKDNGFSVDFGKDGGTIEALRENGVTVSPVNGYCISEIYAVGSAGELEENSSSLTKLAVCEDPSTGKLKLSGKLFGKPTDDAVIEAEKAVGKVINGCADEIKRVADANSAKKEKEKKETERYSIYVYLEKIDIKASIELNYAPGEAVFGDEENVIVDDGNSFTAVSEVIEDEEKKSPSHTVLPLIQERSEKALIEQGLEFDTWQLVFSNGSRCDVKPGDVISPYASCTVEAKWKHVICVCFDDCSKTYDTEPLYGAVKSVSGLKAGETLSLDEGVLSTSLTDAGEKDYSISLDDIADGKLHVKDAAGTDITESYIDPEDLSNIRLISGKLTVTQRALTVTVSDASQDYSSFPLTASEFTTNGLIDGQTVSLSYTGSQTVPGTSDSGAESIKVMNGEIDVTANYSITVIGGKLTVNSLAGDNRRSITVKPANAEKVYDGTALVPSDYSIVLGELSEGETLSVEYSGEQTAAGSSDSAITSCSVKNGETDVSENYIITLTGGSLTVTQLPITFAAASDEKVVDDTPLTNSNYSVASGALLSGHQVTAIQLVGSQTAVGSSANAIDPKSIVITDKDSNDVTGNYDISLTPGTLTVKDKPISEITLTIGSYSKVYDGLPVTLTAADVKVTSGSLPAGYTIEPAFSTTSLVNVGKETVNIVKVVIRDTNGVDATSRFSINREPGTVEITPRTLTIETKSATKAYDGKPLTEKSTPTVTGRLEGQQISLRITGTQTKVGSSSNSVSDVTVTVKDTKEDVSTNYSVVIKAGTLTVTEAAGASASTSDKPGTGDASRLGVLVGILVFALIGIIVVVVVITKKSQR